MCEPRNRDNGASDVWALTAYPKRMRHWDECKNCFGTSLPDRVLGCANLGGISSSILSVIFTDKFALSQSDAMISVAYKISQWKSLTKCLMKCPPGERVLLFQVCIKDVAVTITPSLQYGNKLGSTPDPILLLLCQWKCVCVCVCVGGGGILEVNDYQWVIERVTGFGQLMC